MGRRRGVTAFGLAVVAVATMVAPVGRSVAKAPTPLPIDLSTGVLTQSNCKTTIGCAHPNASVKADRFASEATSSQLVANTLTLRVDGPWQAAKPQSNVELAMDVRLVNPSGTAGNIVCATAKSGPSFVHDCI